MRLSVITINFNDSKGLEKTIDSVRHQTCQDFEFIIVDGGSTDGSVNVIKRNNDVITNYISERDNGIYNAMNKGALLASGEYITFLNSGDIFHDDNVVNDVFNELGSTKNEDIVFGEVLDVAENGTSHFKFSHELSLMSLHYDVVNHSGAFIKRKLQLRHPYREDLKICSDRQFFIEAIVLDNCSYSHIDRIITKFDKTGVSSTKESDNIIAEENEAILNALLPPRIVSDYKKTNLLLSGLTEKMTGYYRFSKFIYNLDCFLIKIYSIFRK